jgi:hypothetical protein
VTTLEREIDDTMTYIQKLSKDHRRRLNPPASNGLLNNLIAYWPGDEANGNLLDAHTSGLDLADSNTVTSDTGLVYATARKFTAANNERFQYVNPPADLQYGDNDFTLMAWVYLNAVGVNNLGIHYKYGAAGSREGSLYYDATADRFRWVIYNGTSAIVNVPANTFGAPSATTWYLVQAWHDAVANIAGLQINDTTPDTLTTGGASPAASLAYYIFGQGTGGYMDGRIGPMAWWKSTPGAGGVLSAAQRAALYNSGAGLPYARFTS